CVSVFFVGLGALVDKAGAKFKSDEKALELIRKARTAIGGDNAIASVQSMRIVGRTSHKVNIGGKESVEEGETEIAMQLPDKVMRTTRHGNGDGSGESVRHAVDVIVMGDAKDQPKVRMMGSGHGEGTGASVSKKLVIRKDDGTVQELTGADADRWIAEHPNMPGEKHIVIKKGDGTGEKIDGKERIVLRGGGGGERTWTSANGKTFTVHDRQVAMREAAGHHTAMRNNEMLRLTLSLLLSSPQGMDVEYTLGGEANVDGTNCNVVVASFGGQSFRLFLDRASNLPVAIKYSAPKMPEIVHFSRQTGAPVDGAKDVMMFKRTAGGPAEMAEYQVKFSDYRPTGGLLLPYRWSTTGGTAETFDVTSLELNPTNISEKFQNQKVMIRSMKSDGQ
ncbi:MAG TPA: hypothetical protein VNA17_02670, partial [Pyrinomonadaceae bacterium]|nr:hypothetical protein [Pyrinomonadaceae bacterium]